MKLWRTAALVFTATALSVTAAPASADEFEIQQVIQAQGIATRPVSVEYGTPGTGTLLLDHFWFRDVNDDQHLSVMSALPQTVDQDTSLFVGFSDESRGEEYEYRVAHQRITLSGTVLGTLNDTCRGTCERNINRPAGDYVFVLRGFRFEFISGDRDDDGNPIPIDHHIDELGIRESNGKLQHWFSDRNDDDEYGARIDYAWVLRSHLANITTLHDEVDSEGVTSPSIAAGNKVIRGFRVEEIGAIGGMDNHIKRFGFLTNSTDVDIYFGDKDPTDSGKWNYWFDYATLR